jgi:EmrB/QacA subfamily drug resistance transporter
LRKEELRVLVIICLGSFFHVQSIGSINVSLPTIQKDFGSSLAAVQWVGMMGVVMLSSLSLCFGRAGDLIGRKKVFTVGLTFYALGAGLASLAGSFPQLLFFRAVMAIGLAMAAPMAAAILASTFPPETRGRALGLLASFMAIGRTTGPTIGGLILYLWGWRAVFVANCLFGTVTCLAVFWGLKGKEERRKEPFDFWGALSLMIGYPSVLIALSLGAKSGWEAAEIPLWFALAAIGLAAFVWRELSAEMPLMSLSYFSNLSLLTAMVSLVMGSAAHRPVDIFGPLYMQNVLRLTPLAVGLVMATLPLTTALVSPLSGRLVDRLQARWVAALGLISVFLGVAFYAGLTVGSTNFQTVVALAFLGAGVGLFIPANQMVAFATVRAQDYGVVSALLLSFATAAGTLGTTVAVALAEASRRQREIEDVAGFAYDQQFAFAALLPLAAIGVLITLAATRTEGRTKG